MAEKTEKKANSSTSGMKPETQALLCWLLTPITSLIWMNEENDFVRFHAKQSLYYGLFSIVMYVVTGFLFCLFPIWMLVDIGIKVYMAIQANKGERTKLPVIGDMGDK